MNESSYNKECKMAEIPDYIFKILDRELYEIQAALIRKIAMEYGLDSDAIVSKFLKDPLKLVPSSEKKVVVTRKITAKKAPATTEIEHEEDDPERCYARITSGGRCTRKIAQDSDKLCTFHVNMLEKQGCLRKGMVDDGNNKSFEPLKKRCVARVWNRGNGGQCTKFSASNECDLCGNHMREHTLNGGKLRHGLMSEPPPRDIFRPTMRKKVLYK